MRLSSDSLLKFMFKKSFFYIMQLSFLFLELTYVNSNYEANNNMPNNILYPELEWKIFYFPIVSSRMLLFSTCSEYYFIYVRIIYIYI